MRAGMQRIGKDVRDRRNLDAYVVSICAFVFAVLALIGDVLSEQLRWAVLLAGVGLLVYRITVPERHIGRLDDALSDRASLDSEGLRDSLTQAQELWIFAPSAVNVLSARQCELLRNGLLGQPNGVLRVVVLDPNNDAAIKLATRQLDDSLDYPIQDFRESLHTTLRQLRQMKRWPTSGSLEYRFLDYNPGFSLVAIDPSSQDGYVIVEFHAFHNETTSGRMHLELTRRQSERWYFYWLDQFEHIWSTARRPEDASDTNADAVPAN